MVSHVELIHISSIITCSVFSRAAFPNLHLAKAPIGVKLKDRGHIWPATSVYVARQS